MDPEIDVMKALNLIWDKVCAIEERVNANEKVLMDDLIGGIQELHGIGEKTQRIQGLGQKYGEKFAPFGGALKRLIGDQDPMEAIDSSMEGLRGTDGFDEEAHVNEILSNIMGLAQDLKDYHASTEAKEKAGGDTGAPVDSPAVQIEKEVTVEKPKDSGPPKGKKVPNFWENR
jgi:hypothetical protein